MIIFLIEIILIYFISRVLIRELFYVFSKFIKNTNLVYYLLALIFLPGTLIHELAHFLVALFLLLPVRELTIFPTIEDNEIKLGEVRFVKKDVFRGILVGIAPVFFGTASLIAIFYFQLIKNNNLIVDLILFYLIFAISSNMFSSKKDLEDLAYLMPILIIIGIILYLAGIPISINVIIGYQTGWFGGILNKAELYLLYVLLINFVGFLIVKFTNRLLR